MLRVIARAKEQYPNIDISCTYLGAHAVPRDKTAQEATDDIVENQLPKIRKLTMANELSVDNIDVFCERGVFEVGQTEAILSKAKAIMPTWNINFHSNELHPLNSTEVRFYPNLKNH